MSIPEAELRWRFSRAGGPGGQGVNTTDSRVELSWDLAGSEMLPPALKERAAEHRSQLRNREAARSRLAAILRQAATPDPPTRRPTRPSRAARERRLADKRRRTLTKRLRRSAEE